MLARHSLRVLRIGSCCLLLASGVNTAVMCAWVLNESLQIRGSDGQPIPVDEQQYYWHPHYRYALCVAVAI